MAKKSVEIQQQVNAQRALIAQRVQALQQRVKDDVRFTGADLKEKVTSPVGAAKDKLDAQVQSHPIMTMAGAFATGVAIGAGTDMKHGLFTKGDGMHDEGGGFLGGALASVVLPFVQSISSEVKPLVSEVVGEIKSEMLDGLRSRRNAA